MNHTKIRVLLTDGGYKNTLSAARSLFKANFDVGVIGHSKWDVTLLSRYISFKVVCSLDDLLNALKYAISKFKPHVILPIGENSVRFMLNNKENFKNIKIPLPADKILNIALDKIELTNYLYKKGIKIPPYGLINDFQNIHEFIDRWGYPLVLKGKKSQGSSDVRICKTFFELEENGKWLIKKHGKIMIQKYINGKGTGYFGLFKHGKEINSFMHKRIREYPIQGGPSTCAVSIFELDLYKAGKECLEILKWNGVAMVEFRREKQTNQLWFIELNPKYWGSLELSIASGVNFPALSVQSELNLLKSQKRIYKTGVTFKWLFSGEILYAIESKNKFRNFFKFFLHNPKTTRNELSIKDPLPGCRVIYLTLRHIGRQLLRR